MSINLSQIRWRCRLGMRELDELLVAYVDEQLVNDTPDDQQAFESLLDLPTPELCAALLGRETLSSPDHQSIVQSILNHAHA